MLELRIFCYCSLILVLKKRSLLGACIYFHVNTNLGIQMYTALCLSKPSLYCAVCAIRGSPTL